MSFGRIGLLKMIFNFKNYLKYLTLDAIDPHYEVEILKELSKSLSFSLHYLNLRLFFKPNNLYTIFKICEQIKIKKLLICK